MIRAAANQELWGDAVALFFVGDSLLQRARQDRSWSIASIIGIVRIHGDQEELIQALSAFVEEAEPVGSARWSLPMPWPSHVIEFIEAGYSSDNTIGPEFYFDIHDYDSLSSVERLLECFQAFITSYEPEFLIARRGHTQDVTDEFINDFIVYRDGLEEIRERINDPDDPDFDEEEDEYTADEAEEHALWMWDEIMNSINDAIPNPGPLYFGTDDGAVGWWLSEE